MLSNPPPTSIRSYASGHYCAFLVKSCLMLSNPLPTSIRSCASGHYSAFLVKSCLMLSNPPPASIRSCASGRYSAFSVKSCLMLSCPIHPASIRSCASGHYSAFLVKSCLMMCNPPPASIRSCASGHYSAFSVNKSCLILSNPPPLQSGLVHLAITVPSLSSHAWWYPIHPPLQSGLVRLAITVPSLSSHAWYCPIHPHFNQVLCVWPLQCLLCQVMLDDVQSTPTSIRSCASGHYSAFSVKSCLMMSNPPPLQSGLVRLAITVPSLSSHAWYCPIHPHFNQVLCVWPLQCLLCQVCLMLSNPPPHQSGLVRLAITVPSLSSHAWWYPIHPPLQSGLVRLAITVPSLSSHAWCCPIHPRFNQVLCVWPLQCLLSQVMLDAVQSPPRFNQVSCVWPLQCLLSQVMLDAVQSTPHFNPVLCVWPLQCLLSQVTLDAVKSTAHFNLVLCVWPLQCLLLSQVMLDAVQSTPTSIRSCASGHYSAFSVKSCLMMSNPPSLQSGLVRLAITVPSLSSHAWWCPIHPHFNPVLCVWPLQCLLCQVMLDTVQSTPTSIRYCASGHYSAFSVKSAWCCPIHPHINQVLCVWPLQCLLCQVMLDDIQSTPHFNQVLCVWPLQCLLCQVMLDAVQSTPASIRSCASGHYSAFLVKSCLMLSNPPPLQSGLVRLAITVPS